jgi:hypothetical protein
MAEAEPGLPPRPLTSGYRHARFLIEIQKPIHE